MEKSIINQKVENFNERITLIFQLVKTLKKGGFSFGIEEIGRDKYKIVATREWVEILTPEAPLEKFEKVKGRLQEEIEKHCHK